MKIAYLANIRFPSERAHSIQIEEMLKAFLGHGIGVTLFVNKRTSKGEKVAEPVPVRRLYHVVFLPYILLS